MKEFKANLKILKVEKLNNSIYGNPLLSARGRK